MATTYRIRYKNHATPQEQHSSGDRWYLDSDAGRKFSGTADLGSSLIGSKGNFEENLAITDEPSSAFINYVDFAYIKNTGDNDVLIALDYSVYTIVLSPGEAFASQVDRSNGVFRAKCPTGQTSTIEYYSSV
jgi:hypothetical protein